MKNNILFNKLVKFVDGEVSFEPKAKKQEEERREITHKEKNISERLIKLNDIARRQMNLLQNNRNINELEKLQEKVNMNN